MSDYQRLGPNGCVCNIGNGDDAAYIALGKADAPMRPAIEIPADERREAAQALAGDDYRVVPRDLTVGDLAQIARDAGVQLDMDLRPHPTDPDEVKAGQYVRVESVEGINGVGPEWAVQGVVGQDHGETVSIRTDGWVTCDRGVGVWYVLHGAPQPEPDEAAVETLADIVHAVNDSFESTPLTKSATNRFVRELIRRGVEVRAHG